MSKKRKKTGISGKYELLFCIPFGVRFVRYNIMSLGQEDEQVSSVFVYEYTEDSWSPLQVISAGFYTLFGCAVAFSPTKQLAVAALLNGM